MTEPNAFVTPSYRTCAIRESAACQRTAEIRSVGGTPDQPKATTGSESFHGSKRQASDEVALERDRQDDDRENPDQRHRRHGSPVDRCLEAQRGGTHRDRHGVIGGREYEREDELVVGADDSKECGGRETGC